MPTALPHGLHTHLKLVTAAAHVGLERVLASRGYFDGRLGYVEYLQRFLAFHEEAEQALDAADAGRFLPDWHERRRAHQARADLLSMGASDGNFERVSGFLPQPIGHEQVLGIAYVLEGSTLGGAFLLRQLASLGICARRGGSYLAGYGNHRGQMWQRFIATLEQAQSRVCVESVASAALASFAAARYFLTEAEPARACSTAASTAAIHTESKRAGSFAQLSTLASTLPTPA
jgi:heme oxygenase (biliverdin-IX-beta and delta-forming)